jgi:hypothetical protein
MHIILLRGARARPAQGVGDGYGEFLEWPNKVQMKTHVRIANTEQTAHRFTLLVIFTV